METGGKTAQGPRWRRVTWWRCCGDGRKNSPGSKMAAGHVVALLWRRAEKQPGVQDGGGSRGGAAMDTGGSTALISRWQRVTWWRCCGDGRKNSSGSKMAAGHVVALLWRRAEEQLWVQDGGASRGGVAVETGGKIARGPRWRRVMWWRCDGHGRKNSPGSKMAARHVVALRWKRAEVPPFARGHQIT